MNSTVQANHNINIPSSSSTLGPSLNPSANPTDTDIADVDKLELESYARRCRQLKLELEAKKQKVGRPLTKKEAAEVEVTVDAIEAAGRVQPRTLTITHISGDTESLKLSTLPHSYRRIRNLLWIEQHPVYRTALAEWESEVNLFASRIGRKLERRGALKNDIYSMIGFYSVFQGVLLTATSQSSELHCQNIGLPIALSAFASLGTLVHIGRKFKVISELQTTISSEEIPLKEGKARIEALKEKGEAFRFYDFREDEATSWSNFQPKIYFCVLRAQDFVLLAIVLFSVAFVIAHPLILCRPGT